MASLTPVILDDWYQVAYIQNHGLSPSSVWEYGFFNYFNYNPRIGENFLLIVNGPTAINALVTPTVELGLLFVMFVMAFGRWPRPTVRDAQMLLVTQAMVWLVAPIAGILYFYRPFCTNYVYAFTCTLLLFVPYRLELARDQLRYRSWWLAPLLLVWGWVAGMTNEHTGPTAIVCLGALTYLLWRKHRQIRTWMVTGLVGIVIGYPMLFFAPGQSLRYGGLATKETPVELVVDRGPVGLLDIMLDFVWEGQLAINIALVALLIVLIRSHRRGEPPRGLDRSQVAVIMALLAAAFAIVGTLFGSPTVGERLFFAPSVLISCAGIVLLDAMFADPVARRTVVVIASIVVVYHFAMIGWTQVSAHADFVERDAFLRAQPKGTVAHVEPYENFNRSRWFLGEDFDYSSLRQYVAYEVYGLTGIEFDRFVRAEPSPSYRMELDIEMTPPMPTSDVLSKVEMPLRYIPSYVDRDIQLVRRIEGQLRAIPGHRFDGLRVLVRDLDLPELGGRPLLALRMTADGKIAFVDTRRYEDHRGIAYFLLWRSTIPRDLTQTFVHGCGRTTEVVPTKDDRGNGLRMSYIPACRGLYVAIACTPTTCWLAGTSWR